MIESSHIARPYARAVFDLARREHDLAGWGVRLEALAAIAADPGMARLAGNPRVSAEELQGVILEVAAAILADSLPEPAINLVKLLVRNGRVGILPDVARAYAARRAEAESVIEARMTTASEIAPRQREQFTAALQSRLGRKVSLEFEVDRELIGGAVVRAGDWVVDGSVRAQLEQLVGTLNA